MIKKVTSITIWDDAIGKRMSVTYSTIDEVTGKVVADNGRIDRIITDDIVIGKMDEIKEIAQNFVDEV